MLILRQYTSADWPVLVRHQYPNMSESEAKKLIADFNEGLHAGRRIQILAVENDKHLVGYVSLYEQADGVASIGVEVYPPYRRQGFAFTALQMLLSQAAGYHTIVSQVRTDNTASLALHHKLGFQICEKFTNRRGHEVYFLSLSLSQEIATSLRSSQ